MVDFLKISRLSIAHKAAEIIMEEGVTDYLFAKKKAAKYLGCLNNQTLPSNKQIDEAIKEYQNIYLDDASPELLKKIKNDALAIMNIFKDFNPHLSGNLLDGVVPRYPKIQINLFSDNLKEIEYILLNKNISFEFNEKTTIEKLTKKKSIRQVPLIYIDGKDFPIEIKVYAENDIFSFKKQLIKDRGTNIAKTIDS
jgi:hypothetical protein|tara:strand:- start:869 stop:1456 length:588 start_codon:yes stop_codon:yes gene_type:complete